MSAQFRAQFNEKLVELLGDKDLSSFHLTKTKYYWIIERLNVLSSSRLKKESKDYRLQRRYESFRVPVTGEIRLKKKDTNLLYVYDEELFDTINEIHVQTGHGARDVMNARVKKKYANVTKEVLQLFADICDQCQLKKRGRKLTAVKIQHPATNTDNLAECRCEVDLIDMSSTPDGDYRYIMLYKDQRTNFMCLKPLKTEDPKEVANLLIDIFCMMGAPNVLESGNGRQFASKIVKEVKVNWPKCVIMHGGSSETETVCRLGDMVNKLDIMMKAANTTKWAHLLRFLQWDQNNVELEEGCRKTPHTNTFTNRPNLGLNSLNLPKEVINGLEREEDLVEAVKPPLPSPPTIGAKIIKVAPITTSVVPPTPVKMEHFEEHDEWTYIRQRCPSPHTSDEELIGNTAQRVGVIKSPSSSPPPLHHIQNLAEYRSHKQMSSSSGSSSEADVDVESLDGEEIRVHRVGKYPHSSTTSDDINYQTSDIDRSSYESKHNFQNLQPHMTYHDSKADMFTDELQHENDFQQGRPNFRNTVQGLCAQSDPRTSLSIDDLRHNPNLEAICSVLEILRTNKLNSKNINNNMNNDNNNMNNMMNNSHRYSYQTGVHDIYDRPVYRPWQHNAGSDHGIKRFVQGEEMLDIAAKRFRTA